MQVVLPENSLPAKLVLNPDAPMSDDDYYAFCVANGNMRFERTAGGEIVIVPPAGGESDYQSTEVVGQLREWTRRDGRGKSFGTSAEFILPTRAALSPHAAWVSNEKLARLSREQRRKFPPVCPEFVVEVMSPSDRLNAAREKMLVWMDGGVELGWLIHPDKRAIYIYRAGQPEPEKLVEVSMVRGEGPVAGFDLDLTDIWAGL
jgi:Uma2 family endonuclease